MKRTVTAAVAGVALAGVVGAGVAGAATGDGPAGRLAGVLGNLVDRGTISQEQADAVASAVEDAHEEFRAEREQLRAERQAEIDALLDDTLGLTRAQVRERIANGETLREIAGDRADELVAGLQELLAERLQSDVADGRLTQEQADQFRARAQEQADAWLAGEEIGLRGLGLGLGGRGHGGPDGHGGPGGPMGPGHGPRGGHHGEGMGPGGWGDGAGPEDSAGSTSTTSA